MLVSIATSLTTYIPMMYVPNFQIGEKIIAELKELGTGEIFTLVSTDNIKGIKSYKEWTWKTV